MVGVPSNTAKRGEDPSGRTRMNRRDMMGLAHYGGLRHYNIVRSESNAVIDNDKPASELDTCSRGLVQACRLHVTRVWMQTSEVIWRKRFAF